MWQLEIKIIILTLVYFSGWYLFEKYVARSWQNYVSSREKVQKKHAKKTAIPLAHVAPMDQTWRYIRGLKSPDWRIRRISCIQLGDRRGTAVVEALIEGLNDRREEVSMAAGEALVKIGDPRAIEALNKHCQELTQLVEHSYESYRAA